MTGGRASGYGQYDDDAGDALYLTGAEVAERRKQWNELTSIEEKLIGWAGVKTPQEISELTGIPAEDVLRRITEILNSVDILSIEQKRAKMVLALEVFIQEALSRIHDATDRNIGAIINSTGGNISRVLAELSDMEERAKLDIEAINRRRAHELLYMIERAVDRSIGELSGRYPELDQAEIESVFRGHLVELAAEYED
jgi:hypothetical protein